MNFRKPIVALVAVFALAFLSANGAFAQTVVAGDTEPTVEPVTDPEIVLDPEINEDPSILLTRLSVQFDVELTVLLDLYDQGYQPGEIWLALVIAKASDLPLLDAVPLAQGYDGHGWGVAAKALGIAPGSAEFHDMKANGNAVFAQEQVVETQDTQEGALAPKSPKGPKEPKGQGNSRGKKAGATD